MTIPQTTKIRISITREVPGRLHEVAQTFRHEITNDEATDCIHELFLDIAKGPKNDPRN